MQIGFIGLGRMGGSMVERLLRDKHETVAYDPNPEAGRAAADKGARVVGDPSEMLALLAPPRAIWIMVPSGKPVDETIERLASGMNAGDIIIDGGNSNFHDSLRRHESLARKGMRLLDVGTSGGIWGLQYGYCLMVGGDEAGYRYVEPVLKSLAPPGGYARVGGPGAGHFAKMVHNGIEYGLMQAYSEGFHILQGSGFNFDLHRVADLWNHASVIRSWLLELVAIIFEKDPRLEKIKGFVEDSGEGRWTILEAMQEGIPAPVITLSLFARYYSRQPDAFSHRLLASLRREFGGHAVKTK
ncbi:MAG TPA: decarboxylating 6-phosphogluconate dehydrogenase [Acidobacteriota bacterium]